MRVLVVTTDFPPHREGGYELHCRAAVEHLRAHAHEVHVLTSARAGAPERFDDAHVRRDLVRFAAEPADVPFAEARAGEERNAAALERALREVRPDVASLWRLSELSMSLVPRIRAAGVPAVGMVCDPWMLDGPRRDPWVRQTGARTDLAGVRWLFVSAALRDAVRAEVDIEVDACAVVPAGVDLDRLALAPPAPWRGRMLYLGRLSPLKGVDTAIDAVAARPGLVLDVVGTGPDAVVADLRSRAAHAGCADRVRFCGPCAPERVRDAYAHADAALFPSRWAEPFGLVPLEAMACGRPVVASGTGGSAEYLIDGANALLAPPDEPAAWTAALDRLAADAALRARLREGGRATAERFGAERSSAAIREALEAAADERVRA